MSAVTAADVQQGAVTIRPSLPTIGADFPRLLKRILIADEPQYDEL